MEFFLGFEVVGANPAAASICATLVPRYPCSPNSRIASVISRSRVGASSIDRS
jgi:hypothetical protein